MVTVTLFEPGYNGELYIEWQREVGSIHWHKFNARKLSRKQFKRVIRLLLNSGQWYVDSRRDYDYGDWEEFGTISPGTDTKELSPVAVVRWMLSIYR